MNQKIITYFQNIDPEFIGGPVPYEEIEQAEKQLDIVLPTAYKEFIHMFGAVFDPKGTFTIYGLRTTELNTMTTFVQWLRPFLPKEFSNFVFCADNQYMGRDNVIGFLPDQPSVIVLDRFDGYRTPYELAPSFDAFLQKIADGDTDYPKYWIY